MDVRRAIIDWLDRQGLANAPVEERIARLGEHKATWYKIMNGDTRAMQLATIERIVKRLGGDLERALPSYEPRSDTIAVAEGGPDYDDLSALGEVSAGDGRVILPERDPRPNRTLEAMARDHPSYPLGAGPVIVLRVRGDSMSPLYPDGSRILVRAVADASAVPSGTDVILHDRRDEVSTLKRVLIDPDRRRIVATPVNDHYAPVWYRPREASITHVVVGGLRAVGAA